MDTTKGHFLVTTTLKETIAKNKNILYLGEWCLPKDKKGFVYPYIWDNGSKMNESYQFCESIYKNYLSQITKVLNSIHNINYNEDAYNIILGNWLKVYIHQLYEKYCLIKSVYECYNIEDTFISFDKNYIPLELTDYIKVVTENDEYHFQQYSQIINLLDLPKTKIQIKSILKQKQVYSIKRSNKSKLLFSLFSFLNLFFKPKVTITSPYFSGNPLKNYFKLFFSKVGFYQFEDFSSDLNMPCEVDYAVRSNLKFTYETEFERVVSKVLPQNIPLLFIEGFEQINTYSKIYDKKKTKVYYTANGLHTNYLYKYFLARNYKNIIITSHQHGGGYGLHQNNFAENYERSISNIFYTWGWNDQTAKYLPHEKICYKRNKRNNYNTVLIPLTGLPRHLHRFQDQYFSSLYLKYQNTILRFLEICSPNLSKNFLIRDYPNYYGWDTDKKIKCSFPKILFDNKKRSFTKQLQKSKILVSFHLSTTCLEGLAQNIPTVMYIDQNIYKFRRDAQNYIEKLYENNIVFYDIGLLVLHLEKVYCKLDEWWCSSEVQKAREEFCYRYARSSDNWIVEWQKEFSNL